MNKMVAFVYGLFAYIFFVLTMLYTIGFLLNLVVPKTIDNGAETSTIQAVLINVLLFLPFAVQHTIMARPRFKEWWTKIIPVEIERSTFVFIATLIFVVFLWQWRPIPGVIWQVDNIVGKTLLYALYGSGWAIFFYSSFLIDHFDLLGLRQVYLYLTNQPYTDPPFRMVSLYKIVRHPLMLGFLLAFWATPTMTKGHLLFSVITTVYILIGIQIEERDLKHILGNDYLEYRKNTPMLLPSFGKKSASHK